MELDLQSLRGGRMKLSECNCVPYMEHPGYNIYNGVWYCDACCLPLEGDKE